MAGIVVASVGGGVGTAVLASGAQASAPAAVATIPTTTTPPDSPTIEPSGYQAPAADGLGVKPGKIKHVWLIVLENKAYDASLTGLNNDSYLTQTLPSQGALLTNYYGTGHSSLDNYISLFSGQAPVTDDQDDCPAYDQLDGTVNTSGSLATNPNYGQFVSAAGVDAPAGDNGCVYPSSVPTVFNQLDANGQTWKLYAQDLGNPDPSGAATHDAGTKYCGAPDPSTGASPASGDGGSASEYPNPSSADATDQYVAKHNPLPWFDSITGSVDCSEGLESNGVDSDHLAALFGGYDALYSDLQKAKTTPDLSVIIPNNCSNGHDAVCAGNNLSGGFGGGDGQIPNSPVNYTGGVYAENLFLEHVIPEIEQSPAFKENGLIQIVWDEAYPPFTYSNSNANSTRTSPTAAGALASTDNAGETLFGRSVNWEPAGPNTPIVVGENGQQLSAGPGFNENLDRPDSSTAEGTDLVPCTSNGKVSLGECYLGGGSTTPGTTKNTASAEAGTSTIADNSIEINEEGRTVTGAGIPENSYVGQVTDTPATATAPSPAGIAFTGSFELVNAAGDPVETTGTVTSITLGAESAADDPQYDAYDPTLGGGDTGAILISRYIKPGTVSNTYYNHYSTLRSLEDIFGVAAGSPGLDGEGHIGYAAQPGLAPFGPDVFTNGGRP
jgi:Phosphoesterase family